ncbi:hypothetical protein QE370_001838 [Aeromicrobium sp. SORGH_AS981]|nr:hypothetical protein [Aeromicrobium sp. SORGH_AS_0981]
MPRETRIDGEPGQVRAAATWLRTSMATEASTFADAVYAQRSRTASAWWSGAGDVFAREVGRVGDAADQVSRTALTCAGELDVLATALESSREEMARARATATAGGLVVSGTVIHDPGPPPPDVPALPGDATPDQRAAHADGIAAIDAYDATVAAWNEAVGIADDADRQWQAAVEQLGGAWQQAAGQLEAPFAVLFAGGAGQGETSAFGQAVQQLLSSQFLNIFGLNDGFPIIPLGVAAGKMLRMGRILLPGRYGRTVLPIFQTGLVGRTLLKNLETKPGRVGAAAAWLKSPAGELLTRRVGIAGGGLGTVIGAYDLYQQGNPVDAFEREGAGYVADVASTAFSASTTAFLVAPNPVTGALAVGTGVVWAGAEVVDHWDDITAWSSDTWDAATDTVDDLTDGAADFVADRVDDLKNTAGDVKDSITSLGGLLR